MDLNLSRKEYKESSLSKGVQPLKRSTKLLSRQKLIKKIIFLKRFFYVVVIILVLKYGSMFSALKISHSPSYGQTVKVHFSTFSLGACAFKIKYKK